MTAISACVRRPIGNLSRFLRYRCNKSVTSNRYFSVMIRVYASSHTSTTMKPFENESMKQYRNLALALLAFLLPAITFADGPALKFTRTRTSVPSCSRA